MGPIYEKFDYISNLPSLIILSLQTCDSKPLIPVPHPPKLSEMCQGSTLVSVRDDKYWESLDKRLMPECWQQAIVAIESPCLVPVVSILSTKESGRSKRWITCITRDSASRPCHTPLTLLFPDKELLDSIDICTLQNLAASETFKVSQSFPTVLAGTSLPREQCESKSNRMYISLIYSTLNRIIEMWEVESLNDGTDPSGFSSYDVKEQRDLLVLR